MVVNYRTFSPDTCDCAFELEIDEQGNATVAFAHNCCPAHIAIAQAQPALTPEQLTTKRNDISTKLDASLADNRTRNLADYDNNPSVVSRKNAAIAMIQNLATEAQGLLAQAQLNAERDFIVRSLDNHDSEARAKVLNTVYGNGYAFTAQAVHNIVLEENQRKNIAMQLALDNGPSTLYNLQGTTRVLKDTVNFTFSWSGTQPNRVLSIAFSISLTNTQKTTIRNALNARFGSGKVLIP